MASEVLSCKATSILVCETTGAVRSTRCCTRRPLLYRTNRRCLWNTATATSLSLKIRAANGIDNLSGFLETFDLVFPVRMTLSKVVLALASLDGHARECQTVGSRPWRSRVAPRAHDTRDFCPSTPTRPSLSYRCACFGTHLLHSLLLARSSPSLSSSASHAAHGPGFRSL